MTMSERRGTGADRANQRAGGPARSTENAASRTTASTDSATSEPTRQPQDRGVRRAVFLAELAEAKELRKRVAPRKARAAELHARLLRTFRY